MYHHGTVWWGRPVRRRWTDAHSALTRSTATEADGVLLGLVSAGANRHDSPLLGPTLVAAAAQVGPMPDKVTAHLDVA